jgi:hypothetical protein
MTPSEHASLGTDARGILAPPEDDDPAGAVSRGGAPSRTAPAEERS